MKARDQDVMFFLFGIGQGNPKFRRELMWFFEENYHVVRTLFSAFWMLHGGGLRPALDAGQWHAVGQAVRRQLYDAIFCPGNFMLSITLLSMTLSHACVQFRPPMKICLRRKTSNISRSSSRFVALLQCRSLFVSYLTDLCIMAQDQDTSKYSQALAQALDSIKARAAWIEVRGDKDRLDCTHMA